MFLFGKKISQLPSGPLGVGSAVPHATGGETRKSDLLAELNSKFAPLNSLNPANAAGRLLRLLDSNEDCCWLHFGDSLSDAAGDFPQLMAETLGAVYPTHTVTRQSANSLGWIGSPAVISTGTGSSVLDTRCAAQGGYASTDWTAAIGDDDLTGITPDLITVFLSHNDSNTEATFKADFTEFLDAVAVEWPDSPVVVGVQNPNVSDPTYASNHREWIIELLAGRPEARFDDVWFAFGAADPITAYYLDNVHPTAAGILALKNAWLGALNIPTDAMIQAANAEVEALQGQFEVLARAVLTPVSAIAWDHAWYAGDAAWTPPADGGQVSQWDDAVGAWDLAQATSGNQPLYRAASSKLNNKPAIDFDGTDDRIELLSLSMAQPYSIVAVVSIDAVANAGIVGHMSANNAYRLGLASSGGGPWRMQAGATAVSGAVPATNTPYLVVAEFNGASSRLIVNEVEVTGDPGNGALNQVCIGSGRAIGSVYAGPFNGVIGFVGIVNGLVTGDIGYDMFKVVIESLYNIDL